MIDSANIYPRTYRTSKGWKIFLVSLGAIAIGASSAGLWWAAFYSSPTVGGRLLAGSLCFAFLLMGVYTLVWPLTAKVILNADSFTWVGVFKPKRIERSEIRGWRIIPNTPPMLRLERKVGGTEKISFTFPIDDALNAWFDGIPSLDEEDVEAEISELDADQNLGPTKEQREEALKRAKGQTRALSIVSWIACAFGWFYPHPYSIVMLVLAVLPWAGVALARHWRGVVRIDEKRKQIRPSVSTPVLFPGFILALRAVTDIDAIFNPWTVIVMAAVTGVLVSALFWVDSSLRSNRGTGIIICLLMCAYGYGAVSEANMLLDRKPAQMYRVAIVSKHEDSGKTTTYYIDPAPWGPERKARELSVGRTTYNAANVGDTASIALRKGALGMQWYYLDSWDSSGNSPAQ